MTIMTPGSFSGAEPASGQADQVVEIRVHGVNEATSFGMLGAPRLVAANGRFGPRTEVPPGSPSHLLWAFIWSHTSRASARLLWYLALPFTFVNVAGFARPPAGAGRAAAFSTGLTRVLVVLVGIVVTISAFVWSLAVVETALRNFFVADNGRVVSVWAAGVVGGVFIVGMICRLLYLRHTALNHSGRPLAEVTIAAIAAVVGATLVCILAPPTRWDGPDWLPGVMTVMTPLSAHPTDYCVANGPSSQEFTRNWDVLASWGILTTLLAIVVIALCGIASLITPHANGGPSRGRGAIAASGFAMFMAITVANILGSGLRLGVDWLMSLISDRSLSFAPFFADDAGPNFRDRSILSFELSNRLCSPGAAFVDFLPVVGTLLIAGIAISYICVSWKRSAGPTPGDPVHQSRATALFLRFHRLVGAIDARLGVALVIASVVGTGILILASLLADAGNRKGPNDFWHVLADFVTLGSIVVGIVLVALVFTGGQLHAIKRVLGIVADVVAFWPVSWSPLGGRSYRPIVLDALEDRLKNTPHGAVLVGHSQGSILCVWLLGNGSDNPDDSSRLTLGKDATSRIFLVTCGSPILTLYGTIFPAQFDDALLTKALGSLQPAGALDPDEKLWMNFWRRTDPIASPLANAFSGLSASGAFDDRELEDPREHGNKPLNHLDYWNDPVQASYIAEVVTAMASTGGSAGGGTTAGH